MTTESLAYCPYCGVDFIYCVVAGENYDDDNDCPQCPYCLMSLTGN